MTEAVGVHAHPTLKLGRRAPSLRPSVAVGAFLLAGLPAHPATDPVPPLAYPMDRNDQVGDCVVAGLDHALQTISAALGAPRANWTDAQLLAFYQTQNPGFRSWADAGGPNDQGMDIQTFLEHLVSTGDIVAFGRLDHTDLDLLRAAVWVGVAVVTGEDLQVAQQSQTVWDFHQSAEWGGHCTCSVSFDAGDEGVVTWGGVTQVTNAFIQHQVSEAWFVLTRAHLADPSFRDGFDLAGFAAAVSELTGGKVVVPVPPGPAPSPTPPAPSPTPPAPSPVPPADPLADFPFALLDAWAARRWKCGAKAAAAYRAWKQEHGL